MKKDARKLFFDELYIKSPNRNYPCKELIYIDFDEVCGIASADMIDYKISYNKAFRFLFFKF